MDSQKSVLKSTISELLEVGDSIKINSSYTLLYKERIKIVLETLLDKLRILQLSIELDKIEKKEKEQKKELTYTFVMDNLFMIIYKDLCKPECKIFDIKDKGENGIKAYSLEDIINSREKKAGWLDFTSSISDLIKDIRKENVEIFEEKKSINEI